MSKFYLNFARLFLKGDATESVMVGLADETIKKTVYNQQNGRNEPLIANIFREAFLADFIADFSGDISIDLDVFLASVADHLVNASLLTKESEEKVRWALGATELQEALKKIELRD